jgi:ribosomal protein RSM22 (predicted rRNA methylase)
MQLPERVRRSIEERAGAIGFSELKRAAAAISETYRAGGAVRLSGAERAAAYLAVRMPATYAAAYAALREVRERLGDRVIESVLDAGAGAGAASLAARELFPAARITMVERDAALTAAAREWLPDALCVAADIERMDPFPPHDLVMAAYALGEMERPPTTRLWDAARVALVVIEPGSVRGFSLVREIRDGLLARSARMLAPCPHESACPLEAPEWCHFAARVERSGIHRRLKDADLNYEDEKFSYVALAREPTELPAARIIRRPRQRPGLIELELCGRDGLRSERVTRSDREAFRAARHAGWGDAWAR